MKKGFPQTPFEKFYLLVGLWEGGHVISLTNYICLSDLNVCVHTPLGPRPPTQSPIGTQKPSEENLKKPSSKKIPRNILKSYSISVRLE